MSMRAGVTVAALMVAMLTTGESSCGAGSGGQPAGPVPSGAVGGGAAPAGPTSPPLVPLGTAMVSSTGRRTTVVRFEPRVSSDNPFEAPAAGRECVRVTVNLANGSAEQWTLPTAEMSLVDNRGQKYDSFALDCSTRDHVDGLVAGGTATARLTFEVPKSTPLKLTWQPNPFATEVYQTVLR